MIDQEIWKDIPGYEGLYQVSNFGKIKSFGKCMSSNQYTAFTLNKKEKEVKQFICFERPRVQLWKNSKPKKYFVHTLVWISFNGEIPEGMQVNHIDENKSNNCLSNLNLKTPKENSNWGTRNERVSNKLLNREDISKPVVQYDSEGNYIDNYVSMSEAERITGIISSSIGKVCKNKQKTAGGFIWKYKEGL